MHGVWGLGAVLFSSLGLGFAGLRFRMRAEHLTQIFALQLGRPGTWDAPIVLGLGFRVPGLGWLGWEFKT